MKRLAISSMFAAALAAAAPAAHAASYGHVVPASSGVTFAYKQMGVGMNGRFRQSSVALDFDPAQPAKATARVTLPMAGVDAGSAEANESLAGAAWFDTKAWPQASFVSTSIRALGGNRYEALGHLTIKGHSHDIAVPFTFTSQGAQGVFDGDFAIKRLDYAIGTGEWADVSTVADEVRIHVHIVATTAKP